jgi:hypothetical protein
MTAYGSRVRASIALSTVALLAGCSPSGPPSPGDSHTHSASPTSVAQASRTFTSDSFVVPFDLRLPSWLPEDPSVQERTFVTWDAADGSRHLRVMAPVSVYRPGAAKASPLPADFTAYFLGLASRGVRFDDKSTTTISGHPATVVTATTSASLDGAFGCPTPNLSAEDCFGFQPDLVLRIAVIDVDGRPVLAWLREDADPKPAPDTVAPFAALLTGLRLTEGASATPTPSASTTSALDGTWTTTYSLDDLKRSPLLMPEELNDDNWGTETLTFGDGKLALGMRNARKSSVLPCRFSVKGDELTIDTPIGEHFAMRWRITGNRLVLLRDDALGVSPTPLVVRPFTRRG